MFKLTFLLQHLSPKELMPIALNMSLCKFRFGQVLQAEGEIPDSMYLIREG